MKEFAEGYDAFVNVASITKPSLTASIKDGVAIFEEYERIRKTELLSSLLMTHLATAPRKLPEANKKTGEIPVTTASDSFLTPDGYVCYNGSMPVYDIDLCEGI
jgi:hypothetical protein